MVDTKLIVSRYTHRLQITNTNLNGLVKNYFTEMSQNKMVLVSDCLKLLKFANLVASKGNQSHILTILLEKKALGQIS
jgi:hypothetical protein